MRESDIWPALRAYWHPVAFVEDVKDKPLPIRLLGEQIAVCRLGDQLAAFYDLCIHRGTPISLGWVEGDSVVCAYHGWAYDADGKCVRIPSVPPDHPIPKKACLTTYRAQERYGLIWVCLAEEPRAPVPDFPTLEDPSYRFVVRDQRPWQCSAARAIENFLDFSHFPWVHEGILGDRSKPLPPKVTLEKNEEGLQMVVENPPDQTHTISYQRIYQVNRPFAIYHGKVEPNGNAEIFLFACMPQSEKERVRFTLIGRNYAPAPSQGAKIEDLEDLIIDQDRAIVENQRPEELPLDLTEELHIKGPDTAAVEYRRMMKELGVE
jgi:vanillate O-demethylase monooxygenase subunit